MMSLLSYHAVEYLREQTIIPYLRPILHIEFIFLDSVIHAFIDGPWRNEWQKLQACVRR